MKSWGPRKLDYAGECGVSMYRVFAGRFASGWPGALLWRWKMLYVHSTRIRDQLYTPHPPTADVGDISALTVSLPVTTHTSRDNHLLRHILGVTTDYKNNAEIHRHPWVSAAELLRCGGGTNRSRAGVIGLTSALLLSRDPENAVTVVAKHMPGDYDIDYTSPWAGANVLP